MHKEIKSPYQCERFNDPKEVVRQTMSVEENGEITQQVTTVEKSMSQKCEDSLDPTVVNIQSLVQNGQTIQGSPDIEGVDIRNEELLGESVAESIVDKLSN